jgi:hypothetical protein
VISWTSDDSFTVSDVEYVCRPTTGRFPSTPDQFCLLKNRWQVEWHAQLLSDLAPRMMVEVGMHDGASMALSEELTHPRKLVGIDRRAPASAALDKISRQELQSAASRHAGEPTVHPSFAHSALFLILRLH